MLQTVEAEIYMSGQIRLLISFGLRIIKQIGIGGMCEVYSDDGKTRAVIRGVWTADMVLLLQKWIGQNCLHTPTALTHLSNGRSGAVA